MKICKCLDLSVGQVYICPGKLEKRNRNSVVCPLCGHWESSYTDEKIGKNCPSILCKICEKVIKV